jgi:hypothetical protein
MPSVDSQIIAVECGLEKPRCILDFKQSFAREEMSLRRGLFVMVVGTRPVVLGEEVIAEVAERFELDARSMKVLDMWLEDFFACPSQ